MPMTNKNGNEGGSVSILMLVPNMVTLVGMCLGLTAIRFAIEGSYKLAVFMLVLSAVADGLDGLLARRLGAQSAIGAQLDSLSDFLCFGVAPAIIVFQVHLKGAGEFGWVFALLFASATCLRLARFNVTSGRPVPETTAKSAFVGVPAPAGAFLGMLPIFLTHSGILPQGSAPLLVSLWLTFVGILMISKLPTPSPKAIKIPRRLSAVILFATVILFGFSFTRPWVLLVLIDAAYMVTIFIALIRARGRLFS